MHVQPTLRVRWPIGHTLALTILLFAAAEAAVRWKPVQSHLPPPSLGSANVHFNAKLSKLDEYYARHGRLDCVYLGTSSAASGVDPEIIRRIVLAETGVDTRCFNLALPGLFASTAGELTQILIEKYRVGLILYLTDATGYYRITDDGIKDLAWVRYWQHRPSLAGWAAENLLSWRHFLGFRDTQNRDYAGYVRKVYAEYREDGFLALPLRGPNPELDLGRPPKRSTEPVWFDIFANRASVNGELAGLQQLAAADGAQVWVVEMPLQAGATAFFADGEAEHTALMTAVETTAASLGLPYWSRAEQPAPPPDGWFDRVHMNAAGAQAFSAWLGQLLADRWKHLP